MDERTKHNKGSTRNIDREREKASPVASQATGIEKNRPAEDQSEDQHRKPSVEERRHWVIPLIEKKLTKNPLTHIRGQELVAQGPGDVSVVGMSTAQDERESGENFSQGRMLFVEAQVKFLKIRDTRSDVRDFVNCDGFAESRSTGQHGHDDKQQNRKQGKPSAGSIFHGTDRIPMRRTAWCE